MFHRRVFDRKIRRTRTGSDAFSVDSCALHPSLLLLISRRSFCGRGDARKKRRQRKRNHHGRSLATERDHESGMCFVCVFVCMSVSVDIP